MLVVENLACRRGTRTLFEGLGFMLSAGELLHLRGANGSGKTSLLRILSGLTAPAAGRVTWQGHDIGEQPEQYRAELLYLGHAPGLKDEFSAIENLQLSCALAGESADEEAACRALSQLGLGGREHLPARVLSQGQRRRVALARLWITGRALWLLDEPLAALDTTAVRQVESVLTSHLQRGGMVLVTTHQPLQTPPERTRTLSLDAVPVTAE